jgi:hypothetical protein
VVSRHAEERPDDPAVIEIGIGADTELPWSALVDGADAVATRLLELDVAPGEPVAYQMHSRPPVSAPSASR